MSDSNSQLSYAQDNDPLAERELVSFVEHLFGRARVQRCYQNALEKIDSGVPFWEAALRELQIRPVLHGFSPPEKPDNSSPLLIIANHPFGIPDGLIACHIASLFRRDFRALVNSVISRDERLLTHLLPIDFRQTKEGDRINIQSRKVGREILERNGALVIFPGGGVATRRPPFFHLKELPWGTLIARLVHQTEADVLPLFFPGSNSFLFHLASNMSYSLRLGLFLHETKRLIGKELPVYIRPIISYNELKEIKNRATLVEFLYQKTIGQMR